MNDFTLGLEGNVNSFCVVDNYLKLFRNRPKIDIIDIMSISGDKICFDIKENRIFFLFRKTQLESEFYDRDGDNNRHFFVLYDGSTIQYFDKACKRYIR